MLKDDHYLWDGRHHTHKQGDIRMPKDALHNYLILDFLKKVLSDVWVENFLDSHRCPVKLALVYYGEASLAYFLTEVQVLLCDFSNARHRW